MSEASRSREEESQGLEDVEQKGGSGAWVLFDFTRGERAVLASLLGDRRIDRESLPG